MMYKQRLLVILLVFSLVLPGVFALDDGVEVVIPEDADGVELVFGVSVIEGEYEVQYVDEDGVPLAGVDRGVAYWGETLLVARDIEGYVPLVDSGVVVIEEQGQKAVLVFTYKEVEEKELPVVEEEKELPVVISPGGDSGFDWDFSDSDDVIEEIIDEEILEEEPEIIEVEEVEIEEVVEVEVKQGFVSRLVEEIFAKVSQYKKEITVIGGSGGVMFLVPFWRKRKRKHSEEEEDY